MPELRFSAYCHPERSEGSQLFLSQLHASQRTQFLIPDPRYLSSASILTPYISLTPVPSGYTLTLPSASNQDFLLKSARSVAPRPRLFLTRFIRKVESHALKSVSEVL